MEILFHDVDGCLNSIDGADVPRVGQTFNQDQLIAYQSLGLAIDRSCIDLMVINTGRSLQDTTLLADTIKSNKLRYLIAEHGAVIFDIDKNESVQWNHAAKSGKADPIKQIQAFMQWFSNSGHALLTQRLGTALTINSKEANLTLEIPSSVDCDHVFDLVQQLVKNDSPFESEEFVFHNSPADGFIDVMSTIDKGDGIDIICELVSQHSASPPDIKTIAIGNGLNDLPMLARADLCLCPANSEKEVIEHCRQSNGIVSEHNYIEATLAWLEAHQ